MGDHREMPARPGGFQRQNLFGLERSEGGSGPREPGPRCLRSSSTTGKQGETMDQVLEKAVPTRRNLFGPVDHEHLQQELQSLLRTSVEQAKQRWNFDFFRDVPIAGLLQWEELQGHEVPAFYHAHLAREPRPPLHPVNRTLGRVGQGHPPGRGEERARAVKRAPGAKKRRQTYLTDYYTIKKQIRTDMQRPAKKLAF